jgi:arginyl-tRNA synthetase
MIFLKELIEVAVTGLKQLYDIDATQESIIFQPTRKEFAGDLTLVTFPYAKQSGNSPDAVGRQLGEFLKAQSTLVTEYNVVKGFLNLTINIKQWLNEFEIASNHYDYGFVAPKTDVPPVLVEYASPNTNKPIHLGHLRNILLGYSVSKILEATGNKVIKVSIINDRGIHICKSMLAWKKFGNGETPQSSGIKGDHLVGKYYVEFDKHYKQQVAELVSSGMSKEEADKRAPIMKEVRQMLIDWEQGDAEVRQLWQTMNGWVYDGFDVTYKNLEVDFDKLYYESDTYLLGKQMVEEGLRKGVFYQKEDNSVWIDLREEGLDEKIVQRADGTSVYITQDLGTAKLRYEEYGFKSKIYVVGNEQDYHFKVLFLILKKMGYSWADQLFHLSYAMVDLPSGKMKSREGTVVDADDLMHEVTEAAKSETDKLGKVEEFSDHELQNLYHMLGLGALKYFILKVDPEKRMLFNPSESVEIHGNTGPYIQYVHARIQSLLRRARQIHELASYNNFSVHEMADVDLKEKELIKTILRFKETIELASQKFAPSIIANYVYELAKCFNQFYHDHAIIAPEDLHTSLFRLKLSATCVRVIKQSLELLGIQSPDRM